MNDRLRKLKRKFKNNKIDSFLVTKPHNVRWLTGYTGSNGIALAGKRNSYFFTDFRYTEQAKKEVKNSGFKLVIAERDLYSELGKLKSTVFGERIGFESDDLTVKFLDLVKKQVKKKKYIPMSGLILELREVKDKSEVNLIKKAVKITDETFWDVLKLVKPGVVEADLNAEIEYGFLKRGGSTAFDAIVASGWRGALPHGRASAKKIKKGEFITFDMGAVYSGYASDMTRTVMLGKPTDKQKKIYDIVLRAQMAAIKAVKHGVKAKDVDKVARDIITEEGYGPNFGHSLGHGIGIIRTGDRINIHEGPVLSPKSESVLKEGMVCTVEPGIYIPGWGGVRIEDDVVVTQNGCSILNKSPKGLMVL